MGGEEEITPQDGILYPFVSEHLAPHFSAMVIQPEHRFYGDSQPLGSQSKVTNEDLIKLMNPEQAMWDAVKLVDFIKSRYGCASSSKSEHHCPVIAVGGSYPGFLAAMMRFLHSDKIDAAYAASAPIQFYAQKVEQWAYYDHITTVADKSSPGCSDSIKTALMNILDVIAKEVVSMEEAAQKMGICFIPEYMKKDKTTFVNEIMMIVGYTFANYNMAYYPPTNATSLYQACQIFQDGSLSFFDQIYSFFQPYYITQTSTAENLCFDITNQMPSGPYATISSGDWSGVGSQWSGNMWDFQTCSFLIEKIGFSKQSMFPPRTWTLEWLTDHCQNRFQATPKPDYYVDKWGFDSDSFVSNGASRILFTNGLNDGWSVSGIQSNLSETVLALNFENGAHHSDLSRNGPSQNDTMDIQQGFVAIQNILSTFLKDVKSEYFPIEIFEVHEEEDLSIF